RQFWAEAVRYAQHLVNRLPSSAINNRTPLEAEKEADGISKQVEHTPKKVEFKQLVVNPVNSTLTDSSMAEEESDGEDDSHGITLQQSEAIAVSRPRRQIRKPAQFVDT
ncbi:hypothetical protein PIB30_108221, partial [Stylosanthes scabra]|nr:hypothetical protein [Stylosanthes scabra]